MNLILASASPRRKELLEKFGVPFIIRAADIDETMDTAKSPYDEVGRVSRLKALATPAEAEDILIAADTIVVCEDKVLGKPKDAAEAADLHHVTHHDVALEDDEEARQHVGDQAVRAQREHQGDDAGAAQQRGRIDAEQGQRVEYHEDRAHVVTAAVDQVADGPCPWGAGIWTCAPV